MMRAGSDDEAKGGGKESPESTGGSENDGGEWDDEEEAEGKEDQQDGTDGHADWGNGASAETIERQVCEWLAEVYPKQDLQSGTTTHPRGEDKLAIEHAEEEGDEELTQAEAEAQANRRAQGARVRSDTSVESKHYDELRGRLFVSAHKRMLLSEVHLVPKSLLYNLPSRRLRVLKLRGLALTGTGNKDDPAPQPLLSTIATHCVALEFLDVSHNALHGRLPDALGKLEQLRFLCVQNNFLRGDLRRPSLRALWSRMRDDAGVSNRAPTSTECTACAFLQSNQFSGFLPRELVALGPGMVNISSTLIFGLEGEGDGAGAGRADYAEPVPMVQKGGDTKSLANSAVCRRAGWGNQYVGKMEVEFFFPDGDVGIIHVPSAAAQLRNTLVWTHAEAEYLWDRGGDTDLLPTIFRELDEIPARVITSFEKARQLAKLLPAKLIPTVKQSLYLHYNPVRFGLSVVLHLRELADKSSMFLAEDDLNSAASELEHTLRDVVHESTYLDSVKNITLLVSPREALYHPWYSLMKGPIALAVDARATAFAATPEIQAVLSRIWAGSFNQRVMLMASLAESLGVDHCPIYSYSLREVPAWSFLTECMMFIVFVVLIVAQSLNGVHEHFNGMDVTIGVFAFCWILHEFSQLAYDRRNYFRSVFNYVDLALCAVFVAWVASWGVRKQQQAHMWLSISVGLSACRLLNTVSLIRYFGAIIVMTANMLKDLVQSVGVLVVVLVGFALMFRAMYPESEGHHTVFQSCRTLFVAALGELNFDNFDDSSFEVLGSVMLVFYTFLATLLLLNLILARMASTYEEIQQRSLEEYAYLFALTASERRSSKDPATPRLLPPPLNFLPVLVWFVEVVLLYKLPVLLERLLNWFIRVLRKCSPACCSCSSETDGASRMDSYLDKLVSWNCLTKVEVTRVVSAEPDAVSLANRTRDSDVGLSTDSFIIGEPPAPGSQPMQETPSPTTGAAQSATVTSDEAATATSNGNHSSNSNHVPTAPVLAKTTLGYKATVWKYDNAETSWAGTIANILVYVCFNLVIGLAYDLLVPSLLAVIDAWNWMKGAIPRAKIRYHHFREEQQAHQQHAGGATTVEPQAGRSNNTDNGSGSGNDNRAAPTVTGASSTSTGEQTPQLAERQRREWWKKLRLNIALFLCRVLILPYWIWLFAKVYSTILHQPRRDSTLFRASELGSAYDAGATRHGAEHDVQESTEHPSQTKENLPKPWEVDDTRADFTDEHFDRVVLQKIVRKNVIHFVNQYCGGKPTVLWPTFAVFLERCIAKAHEQYVKQLGKEMQSMQPQPSFRRGESLGTKMNRFTDALRRHLGLAEPAELEGTDEEKTEQEMEELRAVTGDVPAQQQRPETQNANPAASPPSPTSPSAAAARAAAKTRTHPTRERLSSQDPALLLQLRPLRARSGSGAEYDVRGHGASLGHFGEEEEEDTGPRLGRRGSQQGHRRLSRRGTSHTSLEEDSAYLAQHRRALKKQHDRWVRVRRLVERIPFLGDWVAAREQNMDEDQHIHDQAYAAQAQFIRAEFDIAAKRQQSIRGRSAKFSAASEEEEQRQYRERQRLKLQRQQHRRHRSTDVIAPTASSPHHLHLQAHSYNFEERISNFVAQQEAEEDTEQELQSTEQQLLSAWLSAELATRAEEEARLAAMDRGSVSVRAMSRLQSIHMGSAADDNNLVSSSRVLFEGVSQVNLYEFALDYRPFIPLDDVEQAVEQTEMSRAQLSGMIEQVVEQIMRSHNADLTRGIRELESRCTDGFKAVSDQILRSARRQGTQPR